MDEIKQNKMGTAKIAPLLLSMAIPMMVSMLIQALYNVVDSIFVAQISADKLELTAVSVAFPVQNLMIAFSTGIGVGFTTLISRSLGEGKQKNARRAAAQGIMLELLFSVAFVFVGLFAARAFFESQTDNARIAQLGSEYLSICCVFSVGVFVQITFEKLLQSTGKTFYSMLVQGTGAVINIILDPILIFGLCGMPEMGIKGAAAATVIGQLCGAVLAIIIHVKKNGEVRITLSDFRPHGKSLSHILGVGLPSSVMMAVGSLMTYLMNRILFSIKGTGEIAATVFGIYFKLQSFVFMPVFGLGNGMVPIVAYNYGARNKQRILKTVKLSIIIAVGIMLAGLCVFQLIPDVLLKMFGAENELMDIGVVALRTMSLSFVFAGYCITASSVFQALGNGVFSLMISVIRQIVVLIPSAYLLAKYATVYHVWLSFPIAEIASVTVSTVFLIYIYRKKINAVC